MLDDIGRDSEVLRCFLQVVNKRCAHAAIDESFEATRWRKQLRSESALHFLFVGMRGRKKEARLVRGREPPDGACSSKAPRCFRHVSGRNKRMTALRSKTPEGQQAPIIVGLFRYYHNVVKLERLFGGYPYGLTGAARLFPSE